MVSFNTAELMRNRYERQSRLEERINAMCKIPVFGFGTAIGGVAGTLTSIALMTVADKVAEDIKDISTGIAYYRDDIARLVRA